MISKFSVKRPYTVIVGVILVIVLGVVSFTRMTTDLLPDMNLPYALVITTDVGASPEEVETDVTAPVEALSLIHIYNAYQNNLDATLLKQADAAADDKIDLFLVEADYALKYVDTDYTMDVADLGITDADIADQYQYTKDIVTDSNGKLKGLTWQGCPGVLFYNREAAKEVLGSDDPADVQEYVKDWDTFNETAKTLKAAGYKIT